MEFIESRGWSDLDTNVCSECVVDKALDAAIRAHGGLDQCDYCEETPAAPEASAPIELVLQLDRGRRIHLRERCFVFEHVDGWDRPEGLQLTEQAHGKVDELLVR